MRCWLFATCGAQFWKGFKVAVFQHSSQNKPAQTTTTRLQRTRPDLLTISREFVQDVYLTFCFLEGRTSLTDTTHSNAEGTRQTLALHALGTSWGQLLGHQDGIATAPGRNAWRHLPSGGCSTERPEHNGRKKETKA